MNTRNVVLLSCAALALALPAGAFAGSSAGATAAPEKVISLQYRSGGATADSRARLEEAVRTDGYNLLLHMPKASMGRGWEQVRVAVVDEQGLRVLESVAGGPLFYVRLPEGEYGVEVDNGRQVVEKTGVKVSLDAPTTVELDFAS